MRDDLTVVYFTSNREKPEFEKKIQETLLDTIDGLPLISVSHEPMNFGENICVGRHEATTQNAIRQIQIGASTARTKYVCLAESDFLYPREYFEFVPEKDDTAYVAFPIYVLFAQDGKARVFVLKKGNCNSAMVIGRDCLIEAIEKGLSAYGYWGNSDINFNVVLDEVRVDSFKMSSPALSFKTDNNMHRKTPFYKNSPVRELEGFGKAKEMIRRYMA